MALLSTMALWLNASAIGTRWPDLAPTSAAAADDTVILVLTHVLADARAAFVNSAVHRKAIAQSRPALVMVELKRLTALADPAANPEARTADPWLHKRPVCLCTLPHGREDGASVGW